MNGSSMKIHFYDVEHGSCCHIITPNGYHMLVDVGSKTNSSIVDHIYDKYFGIYGSMLSRTIDVLFITHPHEDHIYDLPNLYRTLKPKVLIRPSGAFNIIPTVFTPTHVNIATCANAMNAEYPHNAHATGMPLVATIDGVSFAIIVPKAQWTTKSDLNTFSSIIVVQAFGYKFVLTGDNPKSILQIMMLEDYCGIRKQVANATVLLAPHHGRTGEFCKEFFECVNPILTVVSDKSIEHNTQTDTAKLYKGRGANLYNEYRYVLTTRNDGTITFDVSHGQCLVSMGQEDY